MTYHRFINSGGDDFNEQMKRHHIIDMIPLELFNQWQIQSGLASWDHATIKMKILEIMNAQFVRLYL